MTDLDVVIVNWNSGGHLQRCLDSLQAVRAAGAGVDVQVIVVDNASSDGSEQAARRTGVSLVVNTGNRGFAAACNQGAGHGTGGAILFLNPDTIIESAGPLLVSLRHVVSSPGTGIAGVQLRRPDGTIARSCSRFPTPGRVLAWSVGLDRLLPRIVPAQFEVEFDHETSRGVDVVMGAFFLTTRALFTELGGFDERFFMYYEEVDFAFRASRAGYGTAFLADAHVTHVGHGSSDQVRARRQFHASRSRMVFGFLHFSRAAALIAAASTLIAEPVVRTVRALLRGDVRAAAETVQATRMLWAEAPLVAQVRG